MTRPRLFRVAILAMALAIALLVAPPTALAAGKPDLKTYPASDFKDMAYLQKLHEKVGRGWKIPAEAPEPGSKSVVIATFLRDGSLLETKLHYKSGSAAWDAAALEAVNAAAPIAPLPKGYPRTSLEVHFHFEYN